MATAAESPRAVLLRGDDNVAVAARPIPKGFALDLTDVTVEVREPIDLGHKVSLCEIAQGEPVRKYGQIIGFASRPIAAGAHVHVHNLRADLFERDYAFATERPPVPAPDRLRTFQGFLRPDGRVGTRNYIAVISTVNCSASTSRVHRRPVSRRPLAVAVPQHRRRLRHHPQGGLRSALRGARPPDPRAGAGRVRPSSQRGRLRHRRAGMRGGLCAAPGRNPAPDAAEYASANGSQAGRNQPARPYRPRVLNIQEEGGITRTVEAAVRAVYELMPEANAWRRTEQPASKICLAMECGGSDGNSGVTANPALGVAADLVIAQGGSAVLGETTEIYGAEHLLTRRAVTREVGEKLVERIKWWEWYTGVFGARIDNNPSPGNKAGGLTTIYEKSLGALAKAGSTPLVDVVHYAAPVTSPGLVFMDTPGYDPPCTTGLVAGGRERPGLHHRPGQRARPQADPVHQACHQHADVRPDDRRHGHERRNHPRRRAGRERGPPALRADPRGGQRNDDQERAARGRRGGVRPLDHRAHAVTAPAKSARRRRVPSSARFAAAGSILPPGCFLLLAVLELRWLGWFLVEPLPNFPSETGHAAAGALALEGVSRGRSRHHLSRVADRPGGAGAEPRREPARAVAHRGRGRAHRAGGAWPGRVRPGGPCGCATASGWQSGWPSTSAWAPPDWACSRCLPAAQACLTPGSSGSAWADRRGRAGHVEDLADRAAAARGARAFLPALIIAPFLVIMLLGAMLPAIDFDVLEYHLQGPKEYFQAGRIAFLPHNVYTNMPFGVEMLHLMGMEVLGDWWWGGLVGQLLVALYAPAAAVLIAAATGAGGIARAAWLAAIIYLSTPWIYRLAVIAYVEGPLCFYHAALVWAAIRGWNETRPERGPLVDAARPAGRRGDGLQVPRLDLGRHPAWACWRWLTAGGRVRSPRCWPIFWAGRS